VGAWVIKEAIEVFLEANTELMDSGSNRLFYNELFEAARSVEGVGRPHRARMRRIAGFWDIDLDLELNPELSVREAHAVCGKVEAAIRAALDNVYDITIHVEPIGDKEPEGFGVDEESVKGLK
jgi:divalent metal cation (Fe/Co/Zn/Cd) transporter